MFYRVESLDSVSGETDEMYSKLWQTKGNTVYYYATLFVFIDTLLQSLDAASSETAKLREQNFNLIRENVVSVL